jgi:hypothetical protein
MSLEADIGRQVHRAEICRALLTFEIGFVWIRVPEQKFSTIPVDSTDLAEILNFQADGKSVGRERRRGECK